MDIRDTDDGRPHVVIVGAGFGGLYCARALRRAPVRVTVLDRKNHHLFQPLLYQVATASLNPSDIAAPIRSILRGQSNATVLLGEVCRIDPEAREVHLAEGSLRYDFLVVATGATHSYFNHPEWAEFAPGLKTIEDAIDIRRRVLLSYEAAEKESDPARQREWLTFAVVGGGPTGVELAGALAEISRHTLSRDFRRIRSFEARVILIEGLDRILPTYSPELSEKGRRQLEKLGVEVITGARVTSIDEEGLSIREQRISTRTVLWAAGVQASPLAESLGVPLDRAGRVLVNPDLTIPQHDELFVIGDLAAVPWRDAIVPGVAPAAIQEGQYVARAIDDRLRSRRTKPFQYRDKGSLATIGRASGVADIGRLELSGPIAWLAWLFIHIVFLIGFRNRLLVMIQWAWSYLTYKRGARLITGDSKPPSESSGQSISS